MPSWNQEKVATVHGWVCITNKLVKDVTPNVRRSAQACPELKRSGMVERDAVVPRGVCSDTVHDTALGSGGDRRAAPGGNGAAR